VFATTKEATLPELDLQAGGGVTILDSALCGIIGHTLASVACIVFMVGT